MVDKVDSLSNLLTTLYQKKTSESTTEIAGEDNNRREEQLSKLNSNVEKLREDLLKRVAGATSVSSTDFAKVPLMEITTSIAEAIQEIDVEKNELISQDNKKLLQDFTKELEKLQDKNIKEFSKISESLLKLADEMSKSGDNTVSSFGERAKEKIIGAQAIEKGVQLKGDNDTFYNRLKRSFARPEQIDQTTGVAKIGGFKGLMSNIFKPAPGSLANDLFVSDTQKRTDMLETQQMDLNRESAIKGELSSLGRVRGEAEGPRAPISRIADLNDRDIEKLQSQGIMKDGIGMVSTDPGSSAKALSIEEINQRLNTPDQPATANEVLKNSITSDQAEIKAGLFEDPNAERMERIADGIEKIAETNGDILELLQDKLDQIIQASGTGDGSDTNIVPVGSPKGFLRGAGRFARNAVRGAARFARNTVRGAGNLARNAFRGGGNLIRGGLNLARGAAGAIGGTAVAGATGAVAATGAMLYGVDQFMKSTNRESRARQEEGIEQFGLSGNNVEGYVLNGENVGGYKNLPEYYKNVVDGYGANSRGGSAQRAREYVQSHNPDGSLKDTATGTVEGSGVSQNVLGDSNPTVATVDSSSSAGSATAVGSFQSGDSENTTGNGLETMTSSANQASMSNQVVNVPPPTVINAGGNNGVEKVAETLAQIGGMRNVRSDDPSWRRFQDRRSFG